MADILIRGIEIPDKKPICVVIDAAGQARLYNLLSDCYCDNELYEVVELSPHGDLIDREWLKELAWERKEEFGCAFVDALDIAITPTIVPANKEEAEDALKGEHDGL